MSDLAPVSISVDAAGGDLAPAEVLAGVSIAVAADSALTVLLTGPRDIVEPYAAASAGRVVAVPTSEIIEMGEHPAAAVRTKRDSSIVVGCRLVREGRASAFFSAGSTGAAMAAATLVMGRVKGVSRPAIATVLPTRGRPVVLLDAGANADCKAENLLDFARMGLAYSRVVLDVVEPRVALLNIGEEPTKGSQLALDSYALLSDGLDEFVGNVEAHHLLDGELDVVVTDGFTGNVALKLLEGTSKSLLDQVREALTSTALASLAAAAARPALRLLRDRLDPDAYGGAPLLGVEGICIIGHGSSNATAVANGIRVGAYASRGDLTGRIRSSFSHDV